uniref:C2H2-type domain-containing protein n=1 Tax=Knipowitschia caucasica TaxID=637954 RepID=A0AAV2L6W0_KNICA
MTSKGGLVGGVSSSHCITCGVYCRSHAYFLSHLASAHPTLLHSAPVGRLGKVFLYQQSGKLFHCEICFYSHRDFTQDPELDRSQLENELENEVEDKRRSPPPTVAPPLTLAPPPLTLAPPPPVARPLTVAPPPSSSSPLFQLSSGLYHCLRCDWSHKIRTIAVNHVVRKHDSPQHLYDVIEPLPTSQSESASAPVEEEEEVTPEAITQELEATNILRFYNNRVECQCGWKAKVKRGSRGFALNHLERAHDLPRSHCCSICGQNFTMSYQLREHIKLLHRPGRYHCPFCIFRSDFYGGFRRHSSKSLPRQWLLRSPWPLLRFTLAPPPPVARPLTVAPPPSSSSPLFQLSSGLYHCLRCDWSHKIRTIAVNHVVRKHDSPQHLYDVIEPLPTSQSESASAPVEEEEEVTPEAITQELEATNILRFYNNRVECQCGWKAKVKRGSRGFALNHLERAHDLPRSHCCSICGQNFTMSYQLREHIKLLHRPGRYHCPFCIFR